MKTGNQFTLPSRRSPSFTERLDNLSFGKILLVGLAIYCGTVLFFSILEFLIGGQGHLTNTQGDFGDLVYFNFISILTIGYGDLSPVGIFRIFTVVEAIIGLTIYSLMVSIVTIKLLLPRKDVVVFSRYAYYCKDHKAFLIIYLNTAKQFVTNLETTWYFKLKEDWHTNIPFKVPFITNSVQTFYLYYNKSLEEIVPNLHGFDCLRVGLSGILGMSTYSTFVQYDLKDILGIDNRSILTKYEGFYKVDQFIGTSEFESYFHYCPSLARTLDSFLTNRTE
jgi:hypothetical protein